MAPGSIFGQERLEFSRLDVRFLIDVALGNIANDGIAQASAEVRSDLIAVSMAPWASSPFPRSAASTPTMIHVFVAPGARAGRIAAVTSSSSR